VKVRYSYQIMHYLLHSKFFPIHPS
jgi:hypothetical protein